MEGLLRFLDIKIIRVDLKDERKEFQSLENEYRMGSKSYFPLKRNFIYAVQKLIKNSYFINMILCQIVQYFGTEKINIYKI